MPSFAKAALAGMAALLVWPAATGAQEAGSEAPAAAAPAASVATPTKPIPYTQLNPSRPTKPRPAARVAAPRPNGAPTAATGAPSLAAAPGQLTAALPLPRTAAGARLAAGEPIPAAELEAFVDGVVKDAMAQEHIAGVTVSVVQNGQVLLKKGYGFASLSPRRPVDPDRTLFRVGSISKTFTWIGLMKEVEAGRIRLDAPVNLYLPERVQVRDQGYHEPVRVAQLMSHTAGFEDRALGQLFERRPERVRPLIDYLRQERPRRVHTPGAVSSYSNYGAALAGEAVSYVANMPFEQLMESEIFTPLGMSSTTFREARAPRAGLPPPMAPALAANLADGYRWADGGFERRPFEYIGQIAPAGSASSTAADMARYMTALLNNGALGGVSIYGPRAAQAFRTPMLRSAPGINGWAHGFMVYDLPGGRRGYGHLGETLSFMSNLVVVPELGLGVFVSANTEGARDLAKRLPGRVVQEFYAAPQTFPRPGSSALAQMAGDYQGYYVTSRRAYGGLEGLVGLFRGGMDVDVTPDGRLVTRGPGGAKAWVPEGDPADGRFIAVRGDERLAFRMADGRPVALQPWTGAERYERTSGWKRPIVLAGLAALTLLAAVSTLIGVVARNRREFRESRVQSRASLVQNIQAVLWIACLALFAAWAAETSDVARVMYGWPGPFLVIASACALVAAALTLVTLIALPAIWRGGRRVDSWSPLRKLGFTLTVLIYAAFSVALGLWGALTPWGG